MPGGQYDEVLNETVDSNFKDDAELSEEDSFDISNIKRLIDRNEEDK